LAGKEKHRLEEEQRKIRKDKTTKGETHTPKYFQTVDDGVEQKGWKYIGKYWEEKEINSATQKVGELKVNETTTTTTTTTTNSNAQPEQK